MFEPRCMTIPADPRRLRDVREWACAAAAAVGLGSNDRYAVVLAVNEAVSNAIQHGSPSRDDDVRIDLTVRDDALVCDVRDRGKFGGGGTAGDDAESGRGLEILAETMDSLEMERGEDGSILRFSKRLN